MKWHAVIIAAGLAIAGQASPALATQSSADIAGQIAARPGAIQLAAATPKRNVRGGVSTSTADVDSDGTSDVVVQAPPKPKHKPVRRARRHR